MTQQASARSRPPAGGLSSTSRALEWFWMHCQDNQKLHVLDCGPVSQLTLDVLLRRGAKVYFADLATPARQADSEFWDRTGKHPVFRLPEFLAQLPSIPSGSLSAIFCWHLLDLLPRDALAGTVERLCSCLRSGGGLFCLLRESLLPAGAEASWWFESLTALGSSAGRREPFPYPPLTNREIERLAPQCAGKTFLTRSGRREVLLIKR